MNYPYNALATPLDTPNLEKLNQNWLEIEADIKSLSSQVNVGLSSQQADYTAKFLTQRNEYNGRIGLLDTRMDNIVQEVSGDAFEQVVASAVVNRSFNPVANFAALDTTYPDAQNGDAVQTLDDNKTYRFNGTEWVYIENFGSGPFTNVYDRLDEQKYFVNVREYGAVGDGTTNDTAAFQNAIANTPQGGTLYIPVGEYLLSGSGSAILTIDENISVLGEGEYSSLLIKSDVPGTRDVLRISPANSTKKTFFSISNFSINPQFGKPARHGIHLDVTNAGQFLSKMTIEKLHINQLGGRALRLSNPTNVDGFFTSHIKDNLFYGGLDFERIGDSVYINNNTITGDYEGIKISAVEGAVSVTIKENNITSAGGAIRIDGASQIKMLHNQLEQVYTYTGAVNAMVYVNSSQMPEIIGNNMNARGLVAHNIVIGPLALQATIAKNVMRLGSGQAVNIQGTRTNLRYDNLYISTSETEVSQSVIDTGNGTIGVRRALTLVSGWTNAGSVYSTASVLKTSDGTVLINGNIVPGTKTPGTTITSLPPGFRPTKVLRVSVATYDTTTAYINTCVLVIETTGNVIIESMPSTAIRLDLDNISFSVLN